FEHVHKVRTFGTGTDKTHVTAQNIDELRKFIEAHGAQKLSDACNPVIMFLRPDRTVLFRVETHRAEFVEGEVAPAQTDSFLLEYDGSSGIEPDRQHDQQRQRCGSDEQ